MRLRKYVTPGNIELVFSYKRAGASVALIITCVLWSEENCDKDFIRVGCTKYCKLEAFPRERKYNLRWTYRAAVENFV